MARFSNEVDFINTLLYEWAQQLIVRRIQNVKKEKAIASRELLQSYVFEIRKATVNQTAIAMIAFEEHGRFLDMKRVDRKTKGIDLEELKDWIKDIGLEAFKKLPTTSTGKPIKGQRLLH